MSSESQPSVAGAGWAREVAFDLKLLPNVITIVKKLTSTTKFVMAAPPRTAGAGWVREVAFVASAADSIMAPSSRGAAGTGWVTRRDVVGLKLLANVITIVKKLVYQCSRLCNGTGSRRRMGER